MKRCSVIQKEVRDVFHEIFYIPTIEKLPFRIDHVRLLGSIEFGKTRNYYSYDNTSKKRLKKYYAEKFSKTTSIEIQSQHLGENRQLSMEDIAVEYFTNSIGPASN